MLAVRGLVALMLVGTAGQALARCGDDPSHAAAIAAARDEVASRCDCAGAASHGRPHSRSASKWRNVVDITNGAIGRVRAPRRRRCPTDCHRG